jgi:hypothetical protein
MALGIVLMALGVGALGGLSWLAMAEKARSFSTAATSITGLTATSPAGSYLAIPVIFHGLVLHPGKLVTLLLLALAAAVMGFAFLTPSAQALVSRRTDPDRQGEILGVNQSAAAMARILGPIFGVTLYKATASHLLPYVFGAGLLLLMLPLIPRIRRG